jgi:hypothetical protein
MIDLIDGLMVDSMAGSMVALWAERKAEESMTATMATMRAMLDFHVPCIRVNAQTTRRSTSTQHTSCRVRHHFAS